MKILIIEDDSRIAKIIAEELKHQCYTVDIARDGLEGLNYAEAVDYDLILLDIMLPKLDGINLCKKLRASASQAFILMLTAKDTTQDMVIGLDAGADDYLVKPFELDVLSARIRALSRRVPELRPTLIDYENLSLNPLNCEVFYRQNLLSLTPKEYMILEYFLRNPTRVLTRTMILNKLWGIDQSSGEETVRTHINNLRKKLKLAGCMQELIETIYGVGYRLKKLD
jgi:DNA-binding response OmpR family regulator